MTVSSGWFDPWAGPDADYFAAMAAQNRSPQRLVIGPWSHVGMRGDATFCHEVDFGPRQRLGCRALLRRAARVLLALAPGRRCGPAARRGADSDLRDGRRLGSQHGGGQARPRRALARGARVAARPRRADDVLPPRRRLAVAASAGRGGGAASIHLRPGPPGADGRWPLLRRRRAPGGGAGDGAGLVALPPPGAAPPRRDDARARPTRGRPSSSSAPSRRIRGSPSAPTCSCSRPSRSPSRSR